MGQGIAAKASRWCPRDGRGVPRALSCSRSKTLVDTQLTGTFIVELGVLLRCLNKMSVVSRPAISSGDAAQRSAASRTAWTCPPGGRMQPWRRFQFQVLWKDRARRWGGLRRVERPLSPQTAASLIVQYASQEISQFLTSRFLIFGSLGTESPPAAARSCFPQPSGNAFAIPDCPADEPGTIPACIDAAMLHTRHLNA